LAVLAISFVTAKLRAQGKKPLRLVQTIPMPNVWGRIDHMDVDVKDKRLFVAGLENGSLEVVDLRAGKWLRSIPGFKKTQGVAYVRSLNKVFVASGDDGMLRVFRGDTLDLLDAIKLDLGPNRVAYDPHTELLYVGYGGKDAGKDYGEVGVIDAKTDKYIGDIKVDGHPGELLLDQSGKTLFVFVSAALPDDGLRDFAEWSYLVGMRKGEASKLTWPMCPKPYTVLHVPADITKNRTARDIQLDGECAKIIERCLEHRAIKAADGTSTTERSEYIFHRGNGLPIYEFRRSWRTACRAAGVSGRFHDIRATFATDGRKAGIPESVMMKAGGWRSRAVFDRYNLVDDDDIRHAREKMKEYRAHA
jgi:hypothetical protein